jgi:hypothetical protein
VGIGADMARTLLRRWYQLPLLDVWHTALLVAYVMYLVKESIEGCGKHTDMLCMATHHPVRISRDETAELEKVFADYAYSVEPMQLRSLFRATPPERSGDIRICQERLARIMETVASRASKH